MSKQQLPSIKTGELHPYSSLLLELEDLQSELKEIVLLYAPALLGVNPLHFEGATNLVHYLGLRRRDVRSLQARIQLTQYCHPKK